MNKANYSTADKSHIIATVRHPITLSYKNTRMLDTSYDYDAIINFCQKHMFLAARMDEVESEVHTRIL